MPVKARRTCVARHHENLNTESIVKSDLKRRTTLTTIFAHHSLAGRFLTNKLLRLPRQAQTPQPFFYGQGESVE
jgi:hypothetical protein